MLDTRPKIEIKSSPMMKGKWLFKIGAGLIQFEKRPNNKQIKPQPKRGKTCLWDCPKPR
jgi:hypothetical protein